MDSSERASKSFGNGLFAIFPYETSARATEVRVLDHGFDPVEPFVKNGRLGIRAIEQFRHITETDITLFQLLEVEHADTALAYDFIPLESEVYLF